MTPRNLRWARRLLLPLAALPLLQTTGCDPGATAIQLGSSIATGLLQQFITAGSSAFVTFLTQTFPGAGLLRAFLGTGS